MSFTRSILLSTSNTGVAVLRATSTACAVLLAEAARRVGHKQQQVALLERRAHGVHQALVQRRVGLVNAGRIEKDDLRLRRGDHALDDVRVVCGLSATMATFWPTRAFSSVDLPAFGRPMIETKPERNDVFMWRLFAVW